MKNNLIVLISIFICCAVDLSAFQLPDIKPEYSLKWALWVDHYPDQEHKKYTYSEILDLNFGFHTAPEKDEHIWLLLSFYQDDYTKQIRLEDTGFIKNGDKWSGGFLYQRNTGIGSKSRIYSLDISNKFAREPAVIAYSFGGITIKHGKKNNQLNLNIGGNDFNNIIIDWGWRMKTATQEHHFSFLAQSRDNNYQETLSAVNYEGFFNNNLLWIYGASSAAYIYDREGKFEDKKQLIYFAEAILHLGSVQLGANLYSEYCNGDLLENNSHILGSFEYKNNSLSLLYRINKWSPDNESQNLAFIINHKFTRHFESSIIARVWFPQYVGSFHEIGLQICVE